MNTKYSDAFGGSQSDHLTLLRLQPSYRRSEKIADIQAYESIPCFVRQRRRTNNE
ncbi:MULTISPECIES: hypothetical protein [Chroococcidiopsis]|uniref:hypothetical protein n=1 Tax=Chroococcidiopsis TaxID=54298 RepID=UPI0003136C3C|nr:MULTISPECIES: hypothetical protein [Chroococcidiopsis]URD48013.1 hypothetical protein M5J74_16895 [Chroococcidiopsis sp. CCNUC1]